MHTLDSRFLQLGDCFAHRFSQPGTVHCRLSRLPGSVAAHHDEEPTHAITITAAPARQQDRRQHDILVREVDGVLQGSPPRLEVTAGDLVLWSPDKSVRVGFRVRGQEGDEIIDSAALKNHSIYTHAFGLAGRYAWRDANGSSLSGEVVVTMPDQSDPNRANWLQVLSEGTLVHVKNTRATPAKVEVVVGQTVVWAVENAPGVSITDITLLGTRDDNNEG